jgi:hypothetical protein
MTNAFEGLRHALLTILTELVSYDPGKSSITVAVTLSLSQDRVSCEAKVDTGLSLRHGEPRQEQHHTEPSDRLSELGRNRVGEEV